MATRTACAARTSTKSWIPSNKQVEIARYSRLVPLAEIEANDYNLNIPRYIDSAEPEAQQDIAAHLQGGIPNRDIGELGRYWQVFPGLGDAPCSSRRSGPATAISR